MAKQIMSSERSAALARIQKSEDDKYDRYRGTAKDLIAAGIVRPDQFPAIGKRSITYLRGKLIRGNHKLDETYLRIVRWSVNEVMVCVGVPVDVAREREKAHSEKLEAEHKERRAAAMAKNAEKIKGIRKELHAMPTCPDDFRIEFVKNQRWMLDAFLKPRSVPKHGYSFTEEAKDQIRLSLDAMVEAVLAAEIRFDAGVHQKIEQGLRATICDLDPTFQESLRRLTRPNARILQGEEA